jgi:transposase
MEWTGGAPRSTPRFGGDQEQGACLPRHSKDTVAVVGIDIGKNTFHLVGLNKRGAIILRLKLSLRQLEAKLANLPPASSAWKPVSAPIT